MAVHIEMFALFILSLFLSPIGLLSLCHLLFCLYLQIAFSLPLCPSPSLSLGQQMETMAQFCLLFWSPVGPVAFWTAHGSAPHISYKMQVPFLFMKGKKEAVECSYFNIEMRTRSTTSVDPTEWSAFAGQ